MSTLPITYVNYCNSAVDSAVSAVENLDPALLLLVGVIAAGALAAVATKYYTSPRSIQADEQAEILPEEKARQTIKERSEENPPIEKQSEESPRLIEISQEEESDLVFETDPTASVEQPKFEIPFDYTSPEYNIVEGSIFTLDENGILKAERVQDAAIEKPSDLSAFLNRTLLKNTNVQLATVLLDHPPSTKDFEGLTDPVTIFCASDGIELAVIRSTEEETFFLCAGKQGIWCKRPEEPEASLLETKTNPECLRKYDRNTYNAIDKAIQSHSTTTAEKRPKKPTNGSLKEFARDFLVDCFSNKPTMKEKRFKRKITSNDLNKIPFPITFVTAPNGVELLVVKSKPVDGVKQQVFFLRQDNAGQTWCRVPNDPKSYLVSRNADDHNRKLITLLYNAAQSHV